MYLYDLRQNQKKKNIVFYKIHQKSCSEKLIEEGMNWLAEQKP